ncbi:hypothetical protein A6A07_21485 [Streptomyces sp. CB03911]|nr:hypothetical protein A6A07_21485 [Streptomyces sp. CB03911]
MATRPARTHEGYLRRGDGRFFHGDSVEGSRADGRQAGRTELRTRMERLRDEPGRRFVSRSTRRGRFKWWTWRPVRGRAAPGRGRRDVPFVRPLTAQCREGAGTPSDSFTL